MSVQEKQNKTMIVSTSQISEILGLSDRRIRQLVKSEVLPKLSRGKFDVCETVQGYINHVKSSAKNTDEELDYKKEKTLLVREQRKKVEIEVKILKGELHRSEDVEFIMNKMLAAFRAKCLALPTKAAARVQGKNDIAVIKDILKGEIYEVLSELSDYNAEVFYDESKDKLFLEETTEEREPKNKMRPKKGHGKSQKKNS